MNYFDGTILQGNRCVAVGPGLVEAKLANLPTIRHSDQAEGVPSADEAHDLFAILRLAASRHRTGDQDRAVAVDLDDVVAAVMLGDGVRRSQPLQNSDHLVPRK